MKRFAAIALVALAGCVTQPSGMQAQFESFAAAASTAEIMGEICPQYQMRQSLETLTEGFVQQMQTAGYSEAEIVAGIEATPEDRVIQGVIAEMGRQGVTPGDVGALCAYADREVAAGSAIGRLLR